MIGTGYVGLVSGACIADFGHQVTCVDKDSTKISTLNAGEIPIFEPGLGDIVRSNLKQGRLVFTTALGEAVRGADAVFIAVGTPSRRGDGHADLSHVYAVAREIATALEGFTIVITKSTVPVGTGDEVERIIRELRHDAGFAVVSNPEFLREGAAPILYTSRPGHQDHLHQRNSRSLRARRCGCAGSCARDRVRQSNWAHGPVRRAGL
jgi:UDPglucose 6-dehydrogenase